METTNQATRATRTLKPKLRDNEHFLTLPTYDPNALADMLIERFTLKNDAALAKFLEVGPPVVSKLRNKRVALGNSLLLRIHDVTGIPVNELRRAMGVPEVAREHAATH